MTKINLIMFCEEVYSLFSGEFSKSRFGGAGLQMYLLAEEFAKDPDIQVSFLFYSHDTSNLQHERIRFLEPPKMIQRGVPGISRIINRKRKRELLPGDKNQSIFFSTMAGSAQLAQKISDEYGVKTILRVASDADLTEPLLDIGETTEQVFKALKSIDQVVVQSEKQKIDARLNLGLEVPVVKNGLPLSTEGVLPYEGREHILWVAGVREVKQPHYFLDLAICMPDEKFVMVMPSAEINQEMRGLKTRAKDIPNLDLICEQQTLSEVDSLYRRAKLFINTSAIEGFPNTFLQAAAAGTPVLSFMVNPDNVLEEYKLGKDLKGNFWDFPNAIKEFLDNRDMWLEYSEAGPKYIRAHRDIRTSAEQYKQIMLEVLKR